MADKDEIKRLEQAIKRANSAKALEEAREEYVRLLEDDDWRVTTRARNDARPIMRTLGVPFPTECAVVDKVLELLRTDHPLKAIGMGEPQGIHGIAHVMKGGFLDNLYIKIKIEDGLVYVLSFHQ